MKSKIIILGNTTDWCDRSVNDLKKMSNVKFINSTYLCDLNKIQKFIARIQFSYKLNHLFNVPLKKIWFKKVQKNISDTNQDNLIIIFYDRSFLSQNEQFIKYLRKKFPNCKIIYLFTNIVKYSGASEYNFVGKLNYVYDLVYAFDPDDAKKYNFLYSPLIYSKNDIDCNVGKNKSNSVFYIGKSKDRLEMLLKCYDRLKELKIDADFYIFGVEKNKQKYSNEIIYNNYLTYDDCLKNIQESNCLLDIIQGDSCGFTIKTCEAIYYDKLLITTNQNIKNMSFYDPKNILVINSPEDINYEFFINKRSIKYSKEAKDYFSCETFLNRLFSDLENIKKDVDDEESK